MRSALASPASAGAVLDHGEHPFHDAHHLDGAFSIQLDDLARFRARESFVRTVGRDVEQGLVAVGRVRPAGISLGPMDRTLAVECDETPDECHFLPPDE